MKTQISSILIPTDFSELSESALRVGIAIAKRQNAEITLLHVINPFSYLQPAEVFLQNFQAEPDILSSMQEKLQDLSEKIQKETGVKTTGKVLQGAPSNRICQIAFEENISLIVMGTHGVSGLREFFIGSEAFRVVKNATCPVLTIPGNWQKNYFEKIIFPVRLQPGNLDKYFYARPIIEKNNSELFLLGLYEQKTYLVVKEISTLINKLKEQLSHDNVVFQSEICLTKDFSDKVIKTADEHGADLIILTANLDYDFKSYLLGPFAQQLVNHSRLPVLSIKPIIEKTEQDSSSDLSEKWGKDIDLSEFKK